MHRLNRALLLLAAWLASAACGAGSAHQRAAGAAPRPTVTLSANPSTATPARDAQATPASTTTVDASQTPTGLIAIESAGALALGGGTPVRSAPSMIEGRTVRTLADRQPLVILRELRGQRWVVGDQTWAMATQDWTNLWYQVDGGYVYAGFVFLPRPGDLDAILDRSAAHWVDVDVNAQTATAMIGDRAAHVATATTGKPGFDTPGGEHSVQYRKFNETMTSAQAAIQDPNEQYDVKNVLYTQYFDGAGDALHLNYWQPDGVFGRQRTSHGCIGLELHDAQFLWLFAASGSRVSIHGGVSAAASATPSATALSAPNAAPAAATPTQDPTLNQRFTRNPQPQGTIPPPPPPPTFPLRPPTR